MAISDVGLAEILHWKPIVDLLRPMVGIDQVLTMVSMVCFHLILGYHRKFCSLGCSTFFSNKKNYKATNAYFLALFPKNRSPSSFAIYRPISSLNLSHKIPSCRLYAILPSIIFNHQVAFLKGNSIHHHAALTHKHFQKLNSKNQIWLLMLQTRYHESLWQNELVLPFQSTPLF